MPDFGSYRKASTLEAPPRDLENEDKSGRYRNYSNVLVEYEQLLSK